VSRDYCRRGSGRHRLGTESLFRFRPGMKGPSWRGNSRHKGSRVNWQENAIAVRKYGFRGVAEQQSLETSATDCAENDQIGPELGGESNRLVCRRNPRKMIRSTANVCSCTGNELLKLLLNFVLNRLSDRFRRCSRNLSVEQVRI